MAELRDDLAYFSTARNREWVEEDYEHYGKLRIRAAKGLVRGGGLVHNVEYVSYPLKFRIKMQHFNGKVSLNVYSLNRVMYCYFVEPISANWYANLEADEYVKRRLSKEQKSVILETYKFFELISGVQKH